MSVTHQVADVLVAGLVAGVATFALGAVVRPSMAVALGAFFAAMFYFSRNPWGMQDGDQLNDRIEAVYDRYLP